ncbi:MAG TPA: hypothetical protein PKH77_00510 [Anaerolineae bacterium]|nr:hypothetical protein [Anaerolineae bacterium]
MSTASYYERARGTAALAEALRTDPAWTVYDYHPDQSDVMTDYYAPAHWEGVARNDEFTLVVNRDYGWNGEHQVNHEGRTVRPTFSAPIEACAAGVTWLGNPPRYNWHLEYQGQIIAKGQGIGKAGGWSVEERERALAPILERIRATMQCYLTTGAAPAPAEAQNPGNATGIIVAHNQEMDGVEIRFSAKPAPDVLARLKAHGFRWSVRQHLWYARFSDSRWAVAQAMTTA